MSSSRWKPHIEAIGAVLFFAALTVPMYAPITLHMGTMIPDRWDGLLHTWILAWDVHKFTTGLSGFWNANVFAPHPDALAYSDHLISTALLAAPFLIVSKNPLLAHNAATYLSFVIGGLGMFLLTRRLVGNSWAGIIAGIIYIYCPWRYSQIGHESQLLSSQWLPFALLYLSKCMDESSKPDENGSWRIGDGVLLGLFFGLHALSSYYLAATGAVVVATVFVVEFIRARGKLSKRVWTRLVVSGVILIAILAPTAPPYYRVAKTQGLVRTVAESESMSADPFDYFRAPPWNRLWGNATKIFDNRYSPFKNENQLFAGISVLILSIVGLLGASFRKLPRNQKTYFWVAFVTFIFSLGPYLHIAWKRLPIPLPYLAAYHFVPGFGGLRVPSRFASVVELGLAVLAAYGFVKIIEAIKHKSRRAFVGLVTAAAILAEFYSAPLPSHTVKTGKDVPAVYRWLASQAGDFAVFELPQIPGFEYLPKEKRGLGDPLGFSYMYYSTYHWKRIINGWSGFVPPTTRHIYQTLAAFPSPETVNLLKYLGVKYVVWHSDAYQWNENFDSAKYGTEIEKYLPVAQKFGADVVFEVESSPIPPNAARDNVELKEYSAPTGVNPGDRFNVEFFLDNKGEYPLYSFKLVDINATATINLNGTETRLENRTRDFIMLDPNGEKGFIFTFDAPRKTGDYKWSVELTTDYVGGFQKKIAFAQKVNAYPDGDAPDSLDAEFVEIKAQDLVKTGEVFEIQVIVKNAGNAYWRAYRFNGQADFRGVVMLGVGEWSDSSGKIPEYDRAPYSGRGFLRKSVQPGETAVISVKVTAPDKPGKYSFTIQMVNELVAWFGRKKTLVFWIEGY